MAPGAHSISEEARASYEDDTAGGIPTDMDPTAVEAHVHLARNVRKCTLFLMRQYYLNLITL